MAALPVPVVTAANNRRLYGWRPASPMAVRNARRMRLLSMREYPSPYTTFQKPDHEAMCMSPYSELTTGWQRLVGVRIRVRFSRVFFRRSFRRARRRCWISRCSFLEEVGDGAIFGSECSLRHVNDGGPLIDHDTECCGCVFECLCII